MGTLIPNQPLIYERANGVVYARYRDPPHNEIPRWIVGGDPKAVSRAKGELLDYHEWEELQMMAKKNKTLGKLLSKLLITWDLVK
tara:strand:+ start:951 stop:1205 length:255 start_codon:yes stop_codon:yes gene_type:complete